MYALKAFFIDTWRLMSGNPLLGEDFRWKVPPHSPYDPEKVVQALRAGHHILGPTERELAAADMIEDAYFLRGRKL